MEAFVEGDFEGFNRHEGLLVVSCFGLFSRVCQKQQSNLRLPESVGEGCGFEGYGEKVIVQLGQTDLLGFEMCE